MSLRNTLLGTLCAMALATGAHATTFDLATAMNATPTFSITSGGVTATFSSTADNGFQVQNTAGLLSFSPALVDSNFFGTDNLTITFSTPQVNRILIPFAIEDAFGFGPDTLTVTTNTGQSLTFGTGPDGLALGEPEGTVNFVPTSAVTSLTLSSSIAFAIGNVDVPEPMSLTLLGAGLVGFAASRRRAAVAG